MGGGGVKINTAVDEDIECQYLYQIKKGFIKGLKIDLKLKLNDTYKIYLAGPFCPTLSQEAFGKLIRGRLNCGHDMYRSPRHPVGLTSLLMIFCLSSDHTCQTCKKPCKKHVGYWTKPFHERNKKILKERNVFIMLNDIVY